MHLNNKLYWIKSKNIQQGYLKIPDEDKLERKEQQLSQLSEDSQKLDVSLKFCISKYYEDVNKFVNTFELKPYINDQDHAKGVGRKLTKISLPVFSGRNDFKKSSVFLSSKLIFLNHF